MKKLFIVMFMAVVIAAWALPGFTAGGCQKHCGKKMMAHGEKGSCCTMMKELNLTETQQAEIDKLKQGCMESKKTLHAKIMELHQKQCQLMNAEKPEKDAINKIIDESAKLEAEMKKSGVDCKFKVSALLTPEQLKKMQEMKAKCGKAEGKGCCQHGQEAKVEAKAETAKCSQAASCDKAKKSCS